MRARDRALLAAVERLGPGLFRILYGTLSYELRGRENQEAAWGTGRPVIFVTWHGRLLPLLHLYRGKGIVMLVSQHRDGEYLTRLARGLGYDAVRGSSTRGGFPALREIVRRLRNGRSVAITPDGPQGPREKFKPGALQAARITGAPVIPVMAGANRAWWIEGWDRFLVPKPFARVPVEVGESIQIARDSSVRDLEEAARDLEERLQTLKASVDRRRNGG
jgi:lysophospholipid acyltransferase (LPLAT)-like uncharacterized protein